MTHHYTPSRLSLAASSSAAVFTAIYIAGCTAAVPAPEGAVIQEVEQLNLNLPNCLLESDPPSLLIKLFAAVEDEETQVPLNNVIVEWQSVARDWMYLLPDDAVLVEDFPSDSDRWVASQADGQFFEFSADFDDALEPSYHVGATDRHGVSAVWLYLDMPALCERVLISGSYPTQASVTASIGVDVALYQLTLEQPAAQN